MKQTLLEMVQTILTDVDGDEVNSISDTEESEKIATIIRSTYRNLMSNTNWPHTRRALVINPRSDNAYPTHMIIQDELKELIPNSVRYNVAELGETRRHYQVMKYKDPDEFLNKLNARNNDETNVDIILDDSGIELLIRNDKAPECFTSFDDVNLIFDSYDNQVDTTLQSSKLMAMGYVIPAFNLTDDFIPDLPADAFSYLIEESTSRSQIKLRQYQDVKSEQEARKQSRWLSRKGWVVDGGIQYPNYGRK